MKKKKMKRKTDLLVESDDVVRGMGIIALENASELLVQLLRCQHKLVCGLDWRLHFPLLFFVLVGMPFKIEKNVTEGPWNCACHQHARLIRPSTGRVSWSR